MRTSQSTDLPFWELLKTSFCIFTKMLLASFSKMFDNSQIINPLNLQVRTDTLLCGSLYLLEQLLRSHFNSSPPLSACDSNVHNRSPTVSVIDTAVVVVGHMSHGAGRCRVRWPGSRHFALIPPVLQEIRLNYLPRYCGGPRVAPLAGAVRGPFVLRMFAVRAFKLQPRLPTVWSLPSGKPLCSYCWSIAASDHRVVFAS